MTSSFTYLIAKYIPDLLRGEPRNVGIIVLSPFGIVGKFYGETPDGFDARRLPGWVQSNETFREWVAYWRDCIESGTIVARTGSKSFSNDSEGFKSALTELPRGNFYLTEGGVLLDASTKEDLKPSLKFLFDTLVEKSLDAKTASNSQVLEKLCNKAITTTRIKNHPKFKTAQPVLCPIAPTVNESFEFDYYIGNGHPEKLYQRVPLGGSNVSQAVDSTAWKFDKVTRAKIISPEDAAALVYLEEEQMSDSGISRALDVLGTVARVWNLRTNEEVLVSEWGSFRQPESEESVQEAG